MTGPNTGKRWACSQPLPMAAVEGPDASHALAMARAAIREVADRAGVDLDPDSFTLVEPVRVAGRLLPMEWEDEDGTIHTAPPMYLLKAEGVGR